MRNKLNIINLYKLIIIAVSVLICACSSMAASAEEYYSIGMAYFDLGRYEEAELWLNRAAQADRTMTASIYNLGRLAYERKRYDEAVRHFEEILKLDPFNIFALKAAAYTRIMLGDLQTADAHYKTLLSLVPQSADDGYNHALVLYAMNRLGEAQTVLENYPFALLDSREVILLYARILKAQDKIEAIDVYAAFLNNYSDPKARFEYASVLEQHEFYARSLEEFRLCLSETQVSSVDPARSSIRFAIARVLLTADSTGTEGIIELEAAIEHGFNDINAVQALMNIRGLSQINLNNIQNIINKMHGEDISENNSEIDSQL